MAEEKKKDIVPLSNICEIGGNVYLKLEMPGVDKENLEVKIEQDTLEITGTRMPEESDGKYLLRERRIADYYKAFTLDETINRNKIDAVMKNGVLTITLYMKEAKKPKSIAVRVE